MLCQIKKQNKTLSSKGEVHYRICKSQWFWRLTFDLCSTGKTGYNRLKIIIRSLVAV